LNATAVRVGAALGHFAARIDAWKQQRDEIASDLRQYVASAESMLKGLGHEAQQEGKRAFAAAASALDTSATPARTNKPGRRKGYKQTDEARRKMRLAWKRRKAEQLLASKAAGKPDTHSKKPVTKPMTEK